MQNSVKWFGIAAIAAGMLLSSVSNASATTFNFNVNYYGDNQASLAPGSDDMLNAAPVQGDTINYSFTGTNGTWTTLSPNGPFILGAVGDLLEYNHSYGQFSYSYSFNLNGVSQSSGSGTDSQCCADLGPRQLSFPQGMQFDNFSETITLDGVQGPLQFLSLMPAWPGSSPEGMAPGVYSYSGSTPPPVVTPSGGIGGVPEPATWTMMLMGVAGLGASLRRRRAQGLAAA